MKFSFFIFLSLFLSYILIIFNNESIQIHGNGEHLVIMLHGFYGSPSEFKNIIPLFDTKKYTLIIPSRTSGFLSSAHNLQNQTELIINELKLCLRNRFSYCNSINDEECRTEKCKHRMKLSGWCSDTKKYECKNVKLSKYKKLSIIGNSQGGIIGKLLIIGMSKYFNKLKKINFITVATSHLGIGLNYVNHTTIGKGGVLQWHYIIPKCDWHDYIKYYLSFLTKSSNELANHLLYIKTENVFFINELQQFKHKINYILSGYDLNVPFWSSSYGAPNLKRDDHRIEYHNITLHGIEREFYTVPIHSLLAHGTIIGKWKNALFTWDRHLVDNSMEHISNRFKD